MNIHGFGLALAAACGIASGQITVFEPGFVVDQLVSGQFDGQTPRIETVRNAAYGSGVAAASISNGILTVRRITDGNVTVLGTRAVGASRSVLDLRFDTTGQFGGELVVSVIEPGGLAELFTVKASGVIDPLASAGSAGDQLGFTLDFTDGSGGYLPGAYLPDLNGIHGTSLWRLRPDETLERLAQISVPPGRDDTDVRGIEFDRSGAFGNRLIAADNDANQSKIVGVYTLNADLSWSAISVTDNSDVRYLRDIALSPGGALGAYAYLTEARGGEIERLAPDGTVTNFAGGFAFSPQYDNDPGGAASLSIDDSGDVLYVSDDTGVYRIRPIGDEPGPTVLCREPSSPTDVFTDPQGLPSARVIWTDPVVFGPGDVSVLVNDATGLPVPFSASGSGTRFMLLSFAQPVRNTSIKITIRDSVVAAANGAPIDGDEDGLAGGNAEIVLTHRCDADLALPYGQFNIDDVLTFLTRFAGECQSP